MNSLLSSKTFLQELFLASCYHPSPRNVNTGRLTEKSMLDFLKVLKTLRDHI